MRIHQRKGSLGIHGLENERGSTTLFFAVVVLPILAFLTTLTLTISTYYKQTDELQQLADDASLHGVRYLPYRTDAKQAVESYLRNHGFQGGVVVQVEADSVSVHIDREAFTGLAGLLSKEAALEASVFSRAVTTPLDTFLLMEDSRLLAPDIDSNTPWNPELFPASRYFVDNPRYRSPQAGSGAQLDATVVSQHCFNPLLNQVKSLTVALYDYLGASADGRTGVGFFPGRNFVDITRHARGGGEAESLGGEALWTVNSQTYLGDSDCAAASEYFSDRGLFPLPEANNRIEYLWKPGPAKPASITVPGSAEYDPAYSPYLSLREAVWMRAAQEEALPDTFTAIREAAVELLSDIGSGSRIKQIVVLSGSLPRTGNVAFPAETVQAGLIALASKLDGQLTELNHGQAKSRILMKIRFVPVISPFNPIPAEDLQTFDAFLKQISTDALECSLVTAPLGSVESGETFSLLGRLGRTALLAR